MEDKKIQKLKKYYGDFDEVEVYKFMSFDDYWKGEPHTDTVRYLGNEDEIDIEEDGSIADKVLYAKVMDADEYNRTLYANCGIYQDEGTKVLVIVLSRKAKKYFNF